MKLGFIKLGLKTYFEKNGSGEGSNHELVDTFHIFQERGHECHMLSNNDLTPMMKIGKYDWIFVFNGLAPTKWETNMNMFKGSLDSFKYLKEHKDIPYAYFWTDPRYDIKDNPIFKEIPPKVILSQEPENYSHLDKLILYKKDRPLPFEKNIFFSILMNDTKETVRRKALDDCLNWLSDEGIPFDVRGYWPKYPARIPLKEEEVMPYLARVKYSFNCGKNIDWVSQKYWEMVLNGVICFYTNYDYLGLVLAQNDTRRVKDGIDVVNYIKIIESDKSIYEAQLELMRKELKSEYFTGDFIYNQIINKLK